MGRVDLDQGGAVVRSSTGTVSELPNDGAQLPGRELPRHDIDGRRCDGRRANKFGTSLVRVGLPPGMHDLNSERYSAALGQIGYRPKPRGRARGS